MSITIKKDKVYRDDVEVGTLRNFCCGCDLRIHDKPNALFSILKMRIGRKGLLKCVRTLMSMDIPDVRLHWNFSLRTCEDAEKLADYQQSLKELGLCAQY